VVVEVLLLAPHLRTRAATAAPLQATTVNHQHKVIPSLRDEQLEAPDAGSSCPTKTIAAGCRSRDRRFCASSTFAQNAYLTTPCMISMLP
jgi:hypothetical protein